MKQGRGIVKTSNQPNSQVVDGRIQYDMTLLSYLT